MRKMYFWLLSLTFVASTLLGTGSCAYAEGSSQVNGQIQGTPSVRQLEAQFEFQLTARQEPWGQPKATSYYDDLVDHYEQVQMMRDVIDEGIRLPK